MSAIVGVYYRNGRPVSEGSVQDMLAKLSHRGPDGAGGWSDGPAALGHLMLWTTPESMNERLPLEDPAANLVLTADARIDNRDELIPQLFDKQSASVISDSEIILAGYKKWGQDCAEKFVGDFAFAIWDSKNRTMFCARDHFGLKPFYYFLDENVFAFASEIKALFCLADVPRRLNELRVADFLAGLDEDTQITAFQQVLRLSSAHTLVVGEEDSRLRRYWQLDPSRELRLASNDEYAEAFRERFTEAVRCRMRSAFPIGSMLSGGLDSSSITCVARNFAAANSQPLQTFSAVYDTVKESDERPFINAVLSQNGVQPNYVRPDEFTPLHDFERVVWCQDDLVVAGNLFIHWQLSQAVANRGVRIILDGFDGDTTVSHGTGYLIELARAGRFVALNREVRGYAKHFDNLPPGEVFWWYVNRYWLNPRMPLTIKPAWQKLRSGVRRVRRVRPTERLTEFPQFVSPGLINRIKLDERRAAMKKVRGTGSVKTERQAHYSRLTWSGLAGTLESLNGIGGAFGIEYRFPFFDKRLAEFCLSLPPEQKLYEGWNRMVMRRAMEGILPKEVQWRGGKGNMGPNFKRGMQDELALIEDVLITHPQVIEPYVSLPAVRTAYDKFIRDQAGDSEMLVIWRSLSLALWLRTTEVQD